MRFCIDRLLPTADHSIGIARGYYGMHRIDDHQRQSLSGPPSISNVDARSGFSQIPMHPEDQPKTAFWWRNQLWTKKELERDVEGPVAMATWLEKHPSPYGWGVAPLKFCTPFCAREFWVLLMWMAAWLRTGIVPRAIGG